VGATVWILSVIEQVRLTSIRMLRGVFAGVGQLLMAADRFRAESESELERADLNGSHDPLGGWENDGRPAAQPAQTATVPAQTATVPAQRAAKPTQRAAEPDQPAAEPDQPAPPLSIPGYDGFSLASLRARMRGLSAGQLGELVDYEKAHANREEVVAMFERRIAKLGADQH
jgi:hypothetical protein